MEKKFIFPGGGTKACVIAAEYLKSLGLPVADAPRRDVRYLLLDIPSFTSEGTLRSGAAVEKLLTQLPKDIIICGGNLQHPALREYEAVDFLQDETYLCENAYITAECALDVALPYLKRTLRGCPVLIVGWGRIGKCLGQLLQKLGADVTISARNPAHRAMLHALGYHAACIDELPMNRYRLIYNTVPYPVISPNQLDHCREDCIRIELASTDAMQGEDIITARGLPGIHMPESSGKLIADTFIRLCYGR